MSHVYVLSIYHAIKSVKRISIIFSNKVLLFVEYHVAYWKIIVFSFLILWSNSAITVIISLCTHTCTTVSYSYNVFSITMLEALFWFMLHRDPITCKLEHFWYMCKLFNHQYFGKQQNIEFSRYWCNTGYFIYSIIYIFKTFHCAKECFFLIYMQASMGKNEDWNNLFNTV